MAFWTGFVETIAGAALTTIGILIEVGTLGGGTALAAPLIAAGVGLTLSGIGTMLTKGPLQGFATAQKNPVAPWNCAYGRVRVGGTLVYDSSFGDNDKYRDLIVILEAHPCQSVDELLFDQQRVQMDVTHSYTGSGAPGSAPVNTSFTPVQQTISIFDIARTGNVVTVVLHSDIPLLSDGDQVGIRNVPGDLTLNGRYPVNIISRVGSVLTFSYLCGGPASHVTTAGECITLWVDYGRKVYMEVMLGTQTLGQTFYGMRYGTPADGDGSTLIQNSPNPWTANCSLVGKTAVFLRLHYNDAIFANGLPQISFHIHGKNDIRDPRTSPPTYGYTENAALCIADYLSNSTWGFKAAYGTEIPNAQLIAAANLCDQAVALAEGGTEPRYTCNGGWVLTTKRGEVLKNLLTCCAGRLTYFGGQFLIWPATWGLAEVFAGRSAGVSESITGASIFSLLTGPFRWKPKVSISELYNGVKGTFIAPVNNWQSSDFPPYAQDVLHGYASDANLAEDGGDRRWLDIQLPFTISCPTAQRLAKIELMRRRQQGVGTFPMNMAAYQFTPMDVIAMDLSYFAWTAKELEVLAVRFKLDKQQEVTLLGIEMDVQETDSSVYAWSIGEELSPAGYQQAITPSTMTPAPPTDFLLTSTAQDITATWTAPADGYILNGGHIEIRYQIVASPEGLWLSLAKMDPSVTTATIGGLTAGTAYHVQIRAVNAAGIPSVWVDGTSAGSPPSVGIIIAAPPVWDPNYETPNAGDPLFSANGFGVAQVYASAGDGSPLPALQIYGYPPPDPFGLSFKVRRELVSGPFAQVAASVTTVDATHGMISFGGSGGTTNQFVGRIISKLASAASSVGTHIPIRDFTVTANDTSGNFTVTPDPTTVGCVLGDLFTLRSGGPGAVTTPLTADATSYTDSLFVNLYNPGLTTTGNGNRGNLALVIGGHGAFQTPQTVVSNTGTKVTISPGWDVIPDSSSIIVLVEAVPQVGPVPADLVSISNAIIGNLPIENYSRQVVRVEGYGSFNGQTGPMETVPFREVYIWGAQGTRTVSVSGPQLATDRIVSFDTTGITVPAATTLASPAIISTDLALNVVSGANIVVGTYIQIGSEVLYVNGGSAGAYTVDRGQLGTTAASHSIGASVIMGGALAYTLLAVANVPNQGLILTKVTPVSYSGIASDLNYVKILFVAGEGPDGAAYLLLPDSTAARGSVSMSAPG